MCKVLFTNKNVEKGLLNILKETSQDDVVSSAASIVESECANICKRQSDFVLSDKSYHGIMHFSWDSLHEQLLIGAPNTLRIVTAMVSRSIPMSVPSREFHHVLFAIGIALHGRNREMTTLQYLNGMVLLHGGCTHRDVERLAKLGVCVVPKTVGSKLQSWQENLDEELLQVKNDWSNGGSRTYQLVGDNWDKNIIPSYRTSQQNVQSLHLFNVIGVIDRIVVEKCCSSPLNTIDSLTAVDFIPSGNDLDLLLEELTFLVATSVIENNEQMNNLLGKKYPDHLNHRYSDYAGIKTSQYSLGLFDCDEKKTQDVIKLLKHLSEKYVPQQDGKIIKEVFFGGDRLTDERIQVAQQAMSNGDSGLDRLEGFISKIEDFHRLMNFLEAIHRITYNTQSARDKGTMYYYRNLLNSRNVKGEVKNSYRAYKHLYYTVFDAMCCVLFFIYFGLDSADAKIPLPQQFDTWSSERQIEWFNTVCRNIVKNTFFDGDLFGELRGILADPRHEENYWVSSMEDGRFKCHFCNSTYSFVDSLKTHEKNKHGFEQIKKGSNQYKQGTDKRKDLKSEGMDELHEYVISLFRLTALHKNLNTAVDMGDGHRVVRSAKYETPVYQKTHKIKYLIGSIHLTAMVSGTLPVHSSERLIANRFVNISGGKNSNISLDEYVEILNRDTKNTTSGFQTKESIIQHSKEFPHLINAVKHIDSINDVRGRKGSHKLPSYQADVKKVIADLFTIDAFTEHRNRRLYCRKLVQAKNPFTDCYQGLPEMIARHKPELPFRRLRNSHL